MTYFLFSDAEIPENISKDLISRYFADDAAEAVDCFADVLCGEVGRKAGGESFADAEEGSAGIGEGLDVTLVCDQGGITIGEEVSLGGCKDGSQV